MKKIVFFVFFFAVFLFQVSSQRRYLPFTKLKSTGIVDKQQLEPRRFLEEQAEAITVTYEFPGAYVTDVENKEKGLTQFLHVQELGKMGLPGKPALPMRNDFIALPGDQRPDVEVVDVEYVEYDHFFIHPALPPARDTEGEKPQKVFFDPSVYGKDAYFPQQVAEMEEVQKYRGNAFALVKVCPVQFNPVRKKIRVYSKIVYRIHFSKKGALLNLNKRDVEFLKEVSILPPVEKREDKDLDASREESDKSSFNYLILTSSEFKEAADSLAQWKRQLGYTCEVISQKGWTSQQVKEAIHSRYVKYNPKPDFFVIIGDHEQVPGEIYTTEEGDEYASDLYYACMDGVNDYYPDMAHGRISVSSSEEASQVVQKIIKYERNPPQNKSFYKNALHCAQFQDVNRNEEADGYACRRFLHTSEELRDFLINNEDYNVTRVYYTEPGNKPKYYNKGYYSNGEALPASLTAEGFNWQGGSQDIIREINEGKFLVLHRDHGYSGGMGWAHPEFVTPQIDQLHNGDLLPVVFSINCHTGEFALPECFAEKFLRKRDGGAVGVIGAAYYSYSGFNDGFVAGMYDALWSNAQLHPNFGSGGNGYVREFPGHKEGIATMGEALNQGLIRMHETWGGSREDFEYTHRLFHYFGDPAMRMWMQEPEDITANIPEQLECGETQMTITQVDKDKALVTLVQGEELLAKGWVQQGTVTLTFKEIDNRAPLKLTISKSGCRPLITEVKLTNCHHGPIADFDLSGDILVNEGEEKALLTLRDKSAYIPYSWSWSVDPEGVVFENETTENSQNPVVSFEKQGTYSISLNVENEAGEDRKQVDGIRVFEVKSPSCRPQTKNMTSRNRCGIRRFVLNEIDNRSQDAFSDGGYKSFIQKSTPLEVGQTYPLRIEVGPKKREKAQLFIDLNNNGIFETNELIKEISRIDKVIDTEITIDRNVSNLNKLLRLRLISESDAFFINGGCYAPFNGQVEDYGVLFVKGRPLVSVIDLKNNGFDGIRMKGHVDFEGGSSVTECGFIIGKNPDVTQQTGEKVKARIQPDLSFEATLNGLESNTCYYVRSYAINQSGLVYSDAREISTLKGEPPYPTEFKESVKFNSQMILSWKDVTGKLIPDGYLVKASLVGLDEIADPVDGYPEEESSLIKKVAYGKEEVIFDNLDADQKYFFKIFPYSNEGSFIDYKSDGQVPSVSVNTLKKGDYPESNFSVGKSDNILRVIFNTIDNKEKRGFSVSGYHSFRDQNTALRPGSSYQLQVKVKPSGSTLYQVMAWIDYNQNGILEDGEKVNLGFHKDLQLLSSNISIPQTAKEGKTLLRIVFCYVLNSSESCLAYSPQLSVYGATEDYSVTLDHSAPREGIWNGQVNNNWGTPGNWENNQIPTGNQNVLIQEGLDVYPMVNSEAVAKNIILQKGASLSLAKRGNLRITGDVTMHNGASFLIEGGEVHSEGNLKIGVFDGNQIKALYQQKGGVSEWKKIFSLSTSQVCVSGGIMNLEAWQRDEKNPLAEGEISFMGGHTSVEKGFAFAPYKMTGKIGGDAVLEVGSYFINSEKNWEITGGELIFSGEDSDLKISSSSLQSSAAVPTVKLVNPHGTLSFKRSKSQPEVLINGDLIVEKGTVDLRMYYGGLSSTRVKGDFIVQDQGLMIMENSTIEVDGDVWVTGSLMQNENSLLSLTGKENAQAIKVDLLKGLEVNNPKGINLKGNLKVEKSLKLLSGIFSLGDFNLDLGVNMVLEVPSGYSNTLFFRTNGTGLLYQFFRKVPNEKITYPIGGPFYWPTEVDIRRMPRNGFRLGLRMGEGNAPGMNAKASLPFYWQVDVEDKKGIELDLTTILVPFGRNLNGFIPVLEKQEEWVYNGKIDIYPIRIFLEGVDTSCVFTACRNTAPVANAGEEQRVLSGNKVILDGSHSFDAEGNPLSFIWKAPEGIVLDDPTSDKPSFVAPLVEEPTRYDFTLMVNDGLTDSPVSTVVVWVDKTTTGLSDERNVFSVYPNPTRGFVVVQGIQDEAYVQILDQYGHVVYFQLIDKENTKLDLTAFPSGIFFMKIKEKEEMRLIKVVKMK